MLYEQLGQVGRVLLWLTWGGQPWWLLLISAALAASSAAHALLVKRNHASALVWMVICLTLPLTGALLYRLLGVNRVRRRARRLRRRWEPPATPPIYHGKVPLPLERLAELGRRVTGGPLVGGNRITPLTGGEQAYPAMLAAIDQASHSVRLATYIFEGNTSGQQFAAALQQAKQRNVQVEVLVDGIGERYSRPRISQTLSKLGVACRRFLPPRLIPPTFYLNLRNHRKLLCVDSTLAFSGGMNIGDRHLLSSDNPTRDIHFKLEGPIASHLRECFDVDWSFASGKQTERPGELPAIDQELSPVADDDATSWCRVVRDGPDETLDQLRTLMLGAISAARHRIAIVTPYFLPDSELIAALGTAALSGVQVDVVIPGRSNLPYVDWAGRAQWGRLLRRGVRIYLQPPPFDHSKLFVIDEDYSLLTTANVDARSLRLNFELGIEVYCEKLTLTLIHHIDQLINQSHPASQTLLNQRSLLVRLRDRACWLLSPYL